VYFWNDDCIFDIRFYLVIILLFSYLIKNILNPVASVYKILNAEIDTCVVV